MPPVRGAPLHDWPLDGHGAENGQRATNRWGGAEASVREQAVESDGDAESRGGVEPEEQPEVQRADPGAPQLPNGDGDAGERDRRERERSSTLEPQLTGGEAHHAANRGRAGLMHRVDGWAGECGLTHIGAPIQRNLRYRNLR